MRKAFVSMVIAMVCLMGVSSVRAADTYKIDSAHTMVIFKVLHGNAGMNYGRFNDPTGTLVIDAANPSANSFEIVVNAEKIDTANQQRDNHLRGPDFFDSKQFPEIKFKSTAVEKVDDTTLKVTGDLTMKGVTKPVTVMMKKTGEAAGRNNSKKIGYETTFDIKRSEFGMSGMLNNLGDNVTLMVGIEAGT